MKKYFWDVNWIELTTGPFDDFIVCRIADKGDEEAVRWLAGLYPVDRIADAISRSRTVSGKTRRFWEHAAEFL